MPADIRVLVISVNGNAEFKNVSPSLATLQEQVKGDSNRTSYIESIGRHAGATAYANEEAKFLDRDGSFVLQVNPVAHNFLVEQFSHNPTDDPRSTCAIRSPLRHGSTIGMTAAGLPLRYQCPREDAYWMRSSCDLKLG